jgi:polar amino acid transport system substrate-binding protein
MRLRFLLLLLIYFQAYFAYGQKATSSCYEPINVGFNSWAPYSWLDSAGKPVGLDVDMLTIVADNLGCKLNFIDMPVKRAHRMLQEGTLDIMMGASYRPEREAYADFSVPYRDEEIKLFVKSDLAPQIKIDKWQDIFSQKLVLLAPIFGWYGADFLASEQALIKQKLLIFSRNATQSIRMLGYGRGDVVIGDSIAVPYIATQIERISVTELPLVLDHNQIHFLISKKTTNPELITGINQSIKRLSSRGELAQVIVKWQQISIAKTQETSGKVPL